MNENDISVWMSYFTTNTHKYRAALQTDQYTNDREEYIRAAHKYIKDQDKLEKVILKDFKKWEKVNHVNTK